MKKLLIWLTFCLLPFAASAGTLWTIMLNNQTQSDLTFTPDTNTCLLNQFDVNGNSLCTAWNKPFLQITLPANSSQQITVDSDGDGQQMMPIQILTDSGTQLLQFELWEGDSGGAPQIPQAQTMQLPEACLGVNDSTTIGVGTTNPAYLSFSFTGQNPGDSCDYDGSVSLNVNITGLPTAQTFQTNLWQQVATLVTAPSGIATQNYYPNNSNGILLQNFNAPNPAYNNTISAASIDSNGNLWLGTTAGSVLYYDTACFTLTGLNNCITTLRNNTINFSAQAGDLHDIANNRVANISVLSTIPNNLSYFYGVNNNEYQISMTGQKLQTITGTESYFNNNQAVDSYFNSSIISATNSTIYLAAFNNTYYGIYFNTPILFSASTTTTGATTPDNYIGLYQLSASVPFGATSTVSTIATALDSLGNLWLVNGTAVILFPANNLNSTGTASIAMVIEASMTTTAASATSFQTIAADHSGGVYVAGIPYPTSTNLNAANCNLSYFESAPNPSEDLVGCGTIAQFTANSPIVTLAWDNFSKTILVGGEQSIVAIDPSAITGIGGTLTPNSTLIPPLPMLNNDSIFQVLSDGQSNIYAVTTAGNIWHLNLPYSSFR